MITAFWMNEAGQQDQLDAIRARGLRWGRQTKDPHAHREQVIQLADGTTRVILHAHERQGKRG